MLEDSSLYADICRVTDLIVSNWPWYQLHRRQPTYWHRTLVGRYQWNSGNRLRCTVCRLSPRPGRTQGELSFCSCVCDCWEHRLWHISRLRSSSDRIDYYWDRERNSGVNLYCGVSYKFC